MEDSTTAISWKEATPSTRVKINRWFVAWLITLLVVFGFISCMIYFSKNFWKQVQMKHQAEVSMSVVKQHDLFKEQTQKITEDKLTEAVFKLQPKLDKNLASRIALSILKESRAHCIDPSLIVGLIEVESKFNPFAESAKGAVGLMQIRYSIWKEQPELLDNDVLQKEALFWIDRNIKAGVTILKKYYDEAGCDMVKALYRYNTGSTTPPKDTNRWDLRYVNKVIYHTYMVKMYLADDNRCDPADTIN